VFYSWFRVVWFYFYHPSTQSVLGWSALDAGFIDPKFNHYRNYDAIYRQNDSTWRTAKPIWLQLVLTFSFLHAYWMQQLVIA
jgi:hypothetical protein